MAPLRTLPAVALAFAAVLALGACGGDDDDDATTTTTEAASAPQTTHDMSSMTTHDMSSMTTVAGTGAPGTPIADGEAPMQAEVDIPRFEFGPADVTVAVGGTVTWTNSHDQAHTATADGGFDTGSIGPGESASETFDEAGRFEYKCSFHPFMTGSVTVVG